MMKSNDADCGAMQRFIRGVAIIAGFVVFAVIGVPLIFGFVEIGKLAITGHL